MNPEQKKLALELLSEAQSELDEEFNVSDLEKLLAIDAPSTEQKLRDLKKAINAILD